VADPAMTNHESIEFGPFTLDRARCELRRAGQTIHVQRKSFDFLAYLIEHRDRLVSNDELLAHVWSGTVVSPASLRRSATLLRTALGDDARRPRWISTVHGRGYRFIGRIDADSELESARVEDYRNLLLGRSAEQSVLGAGLEKAKSGASSLVLLEGEAGIGKTRLLEWCAERAAAHGLQPLASRCREDEGAPPLLPWIQLVRKLATRLDTEPARAPIGVAPALARVFPELQRFVREPDVERASDPAALRFQAYEGLLDLLREVCRRTPLLLLFDDLHRADASSLGLFEFLVGQARDLGILFVGSMRTESVPRTELVRIARIPQCRTLPLHGLEAADVRALLEAAAPGVHAEPLAEKIWNQTGGNPFFVHQVLPLATTLASPCGSSGSLASALPRTVHKAIEEQCAALSEPTFVAVRSAAVFGREFSAALLAQILDRSEPATLDALDDAVAARLLRSIPERPLHYAFAHVLVRDVLYEGLGSHLRSELHGRVGAALEAAYRDAPNLAAELAHHFSAAGTPKGVERAVHYHERAGAIAAARFDRAAAIEHRRAALELLESLPNMDPRRHCEMLLALAHESVHAGFPERAGELWFRAADEARAIAAHDLLTRAALELSSAFDAHGHVLSRVIERVALLIEDAVAVSDPADRILRGRLLARLALVLVYRGRGADADRAGAEALGLAREIDDPLTMTDVLAFEHMRLRRGPKVDARVQIAAEFLRHAERAGDHARQLAFGIYHASDLAMLGRFDEWQQVAAAHARLAERLKSSEHTALAYRNRAMRALMLGRFDEAQRCTERALALARHCEPRVGLEMGGLVFALHIETNELAPGVIDELRLRATITWSAAAMCCYVYLDREDLVREQLAGIMQQMVEWSPVGIHVSAALMAEPIACVEDADAAVQALEWLRGFDALQVLGGFGGLYIGPALRFIGILKTVLRRWDEAFDALEQSLCSARSLGALPTTVRIHMDLASAHARRGLAGDRARAVSHAEHAVALAERLGMPFFAQRARRQLAALR
jgi:DNA-binding winged helix-turn-helix (wHTH) protein/tetratricopeptide (TPR) repeat protein